MTRRKLVALLILLMTALFTPTTPGKSPTANWDVTFAPYTGKALDTMPVQVLVFDVTDHEHGMWVRSGVY